MPLQESRNAYRTSKYSSAYGSGDYFYTKGKEFTTEDGEEYIGEYHILKNGQIFTGPTEKSTSGNPNKKLLPYYNNFDHYAYDRLFNYNTRQKMFAQPIPYIYNPREEEGVYINGFDIRFFVQRRNAGTFAVEINEDQFNRLNSDGGIDGAIYASTAVRWRLTGTLKAIEDENKRSINIASTELPALPYAISNYTQFARPTLQAQFDNEDSYYVRPAYKNNSIPLKQTYNRQTGRIIPLK